MSRPSWGQGTWGEIPWGGNPPMLVTSNMVGEVVVSADLTLPPLASQAPASSTILLSNPNPAPASHTYTVGSNPQKNQG